MICKKCGAVLPDDAEFCGECGTPIVKKKKKNASNMALQKEAGRYKIISLILACLCVLLGIGWLISSNNPFNSIDQYERDVADYQRAGVELSGTYVVGEDSELPAGRYNIYPPDGESYMDVNIYETMEDAKIQHDEDWNSLAIDHIYSLTKGYKLKAGQIVVIDYDSAFFELVSEETVDVTEATEATEASEDSDSTEASEGTE
ncbi:MAG: zinc ribbon domain-containing protein [Bacillota bacterium]